MSEEKYLIYADILGFDKLPRIIESALGLRPSKVRTELLKEPLEEEISSLAETGKISNVFPSRDDWLIVLNTRKHLFEVLSKILRINIPIAEFIKTDEIYGDNGHIPLKVAIGLCEFEMCVTGGEE
ncbi:hypothetical protein KGY79_13050 [Candidatus Bipolaricaulota bacterium]|nr:hypothetical protein [Candidatus Bipolaricaulota bacterium]